MVVVAKDVICRTSTPFIIGKATIASLWKSGFMGDTFVRNRSTFEKYQHSFVGDLAKLIVKHWLEENDLEVTDYDDVREDNWKSSRKPFDLQVKKRSLEIKSSIAKKPDIGWVLKNENIIQPSKLKAKEITVQVFFRDSMCDIAWLFGWTLEKHLTQKNYKTIRYVGKRPVDFFLMPFDDPNVYPMMKLLTSI